MQVIKKDGRLQSLDVIKIRNSILGASIDSDTITFYGEEPEIKIPKIVKKTGELSETTFQNKSLYRDYANFEIEI